jgi:hypothetical protein
MTADRFRTLALAMPGAGEGNHMGHADFRVAGKVFASLTADESGCAMKCEPFTLAELVRKQPETYRDAWGGRWIGMKLDRAAEADVRQLLEDAWMRTAPKRLVAEYRRAKPADA